MAHGLSLPEHSQDTDVLSEGALEFVAALERQFGGRRLELLERRKRRPARLDFLPETRAIREGHWTVAPPPACLQDRRVEITGPTDPKMVINALNSGANVFMADFEDATTPTWANLIIGQRALQGAVRRTLTWTAENGKAYRLGDTLATLFVRPRGWHLPEGHVTQGGSEVSGSLFDFGLFLFHNAVEQLARGTQPFFYLPKLESHHEAALWNDVFIWSEKTLGIPMGSIRATVLIETLPAAFEMHEILHALREHSVGLNCGRWDYMFSFIKNQPDALLPDRAQLTMDGGFLRAYSQALIQTCHRRGTFAMGGMAAQIPVKDDPAAHDAALARVRADKLREVKDGHDGTWVAHPALVPVAKAVFDAHLSGPNQLGVLREDVQVTREALLAVPAGTRTEDGLRHNVRVGVRYLEAWLRGQGCVPLYNLMEDAATAEISRTQVWQQLRHGLWTPQQVAQVMSEELAPFSGGKFDEARRLFLDLVTAERCEEFLTLPAYRQTLRDRL